MPTNLKTAALAATLALAGPVLPAFAQSTEGLDTAYITAEMNLPPEDVLALQQVIYRLNHALDEADYDLYGSFFAEDGVFVTGFGDAVGPEAVSAALDQVAPFITNKRHIAGNLVIHGEGDDAVVTSYLAVFERETGLEFVGSAVNVDTFERRDGEWLVVRHDSYLDPATYRAIQETLSTQGN